MNETERYFETLFAQQPTGSLIAVSDAKRGWTADFYDTPQAAATACAGGLDVYARVTALRERPPIRKNGTRGRGDADLSAALLALWVELDVRGTPDGRGGVKTEGFESIEHAIEVASSVLEPTMLVGSGGGVHSYLVLTEPLVISSPEDLALAGELVQRYQRAIRQAAGDVPIDSTHDLARVLRPPGTFNGKGSEPRPVASASNGRTRSIGLVDLDAELPRREEPGTGGKRARSTERAKRKGTVDQARAARRTETGSERDAAQLLKDFDTLARIVKHRGSKPKDPSPSGWDFMLTCRAIDLGITADTELASLIRHHRSTLKDPEENAKGQREDYVTRTIANARETVEPPVEEHGEILPRLTRELRLGVAGLELADVQVFGDDGLTKFTATDGSLMAFPRLADVARPDRLADTLAASYGIATEFSKLHARRAAGLVRDYVGRARELDAELLLAGWVLELLGDVQRIEFTEGNALEKAVAWLQMHAAQPSSGGLGEQAFASEMIVAIETGGGDAYIRAGWLQEYIRRCGNKDGPGVVAERLRSIGLQQKGSDGQVKATDPRTGKARRLRFYIAPKAWVETWEKRT